MEKTAKQITAQTPHEHIQATNAQEIITLIKNTKTKKSPGRDQITNKALKRLPPNTIALSNNLEKISSHSDRKTQQK